MYVCMYVIHYKAQTAEDRSSILTVIFYIFLPFTTPIQPLKRCFNRNNYNITVKLENQTFACKDFNKVIELQRDSSF